eukprot:299271_1
MICSDGEYNCNVYCNEQNGCYNNTIKCGNSSICNIHCRGYRSCSAATVYCGDQSQCNIFCHGGNSCDSIQFECGINSNCSIQCNAYGQYGDTSTNKGYECSYMIVKATQSNSLNIDVYNNLYSALSMEIYAPNTLNSSPTVIRCGIDVNDMSSAQYSCDQIQIHSIEGWNDVQLELAKNVNDIFGDYTDQNQAMFCGLHDEYFCYGLNDNMECDNNIVICNNKTLSKSPSSSPTQSPSNSPTYSPTKTPSNAPSGTPSVPPTDFPSQLPSIPPSSGTPSVPPTDFPSQLPSIPPSESPTQSPSNFPSHLPSIPPSESPTYFPSNVSTETGTPTETNYPTNYPSNVQTNTATNMPNRHPITTPTLYDGSLHSVCSNFIVKESGNCGDGFTDFDASHSLYGKCCRPCPDGKAGTYGQCEKCGSGETPNHSRTECEPWQPWWLWIVEIALGLGVLGGIGWTVKWCCNKKAQTNDESAKSAEEDPKNEEVERNVYGDIEGLESEGVNVTVNKDNVVNKENKPMDKSQSLIEPNIAKHIELTQIEPTQNDYKPPQPLENN